MGGERGLVRGEEGRCGRNREESELDEGRR
jgi:hypothetical protein